jgi:hypothetical protein
MKKIDVVNASDRDWTKHRYLLAFGAYGDTVLMVWANSLDAALDEAIDWLVVNAPGHIVDAQVYDEYKHCIDSGMSEDDAREAAEADTNCGGNCGNYILAYEWQVLAEDPTRAEILTFQGREAHS